MKRQVTWFSHTCSVCETRLNKDFQKKEKEKVH